MKHPTLSNTIKGLLLLACLAINVVSPAGRTVALQDDAKWESYFAAGEEFSVLLPEQPTMISVSRPRKPNEELKRGRMYSAYADGVVYVILSFDNPHRKESLDVFIDEMARYPITGRAEVFDRNLALDGFSGRQYSSKSTDEILQIYMTDNHVYIFIVVAEDLNKQGVKQFLNALALKGKAKGRAIPDESQYGDVPEVEAPAAPVAGKSASQNPEQQEKVLTPREVIRKARVITRPEPQYTEEARKHGIAGTVVLKGVFSSNGKLTNIRVVSGLPHGLTRKAIIAALNLRFIPAIKDGKYVSQYIQIEYNFNLY